MVQQEAELHITLHSHGKTHSDHKRVETSGVDEEYE